MLSQSVAYQVTWGVRRWKDDWRMGQECCFGAVAQRKEDTGLICTMHHPPPPHYKWEDRAFGYTMDRAIQEMHPDIFIFNQCTNHVGANTTERTQVGVALQT